MGFQGARAERSELRISQPAIFFSDSSTSQFGIKLQSRHAESSLDFIQRGDAHISQEVEYIR